MNERGINPWRVVSIIGEFWKGCRCWRDEWAVNWLCNSWVVWVERLSNEAVKKSWIVWSIKVYTDWLLGQKSQC